MVKIKIKGGDFVLRLFKSKILILSIASLLISITVTFAAVALILPEKVTITQNETDGKWMPRVLGWFVTSKSAETSPAMENSSSPLDNSSSDHNHKEKLYFCGIVPIKTVEVAVIDNLWVTPGGESIGINLKTKGVLAVGIAEFHCRGKKISPAKKAGVESGDIFTKINNIPITKAGQLSKIIENTKGEILAQGIRNNKEMTWTINPETDDNDGKTKIGLWIRESVAGIGTVSFYSDGVFGALGHPISDIDTGDDVVENGGTVCDARVIGSEKAEKGKPGSLIGIFSGSDTGKISANTDRGVYGKTSRTPDTPKVRIAAKNQVRPGIAAIRCDIGSGKVESFDIEIIRITGAGSASKNMIIEVTDERLLSKTGGIVQGMSGSPIIQNDKLVGAVTHVFVNDPTRGYGIFIENMLDEAMKVK